MGSAASQKCKPTEGELQAKEAYEKALKEQQALFEQALKEQKAQHDQALKEQRQQHERALKEQVEHEKAALQEQQALGQQSLQDCEGQEDAPEVTPAGWRSFETLVLTARERPAILNSDPITYHGKIKEVARCCWVSFPGKYAAGWEALTNQFEQDSVACVFLTTKEEGFGQHVHDPEIGGKCLCFRIYGSEKKWGCSWYVKWKENVQKAHDLGQRLKVVYFAGQVGKGKVAMADLPHNNLWDGVGLGGSQKSEVATLDELGYEYDEIDVASFLQNQFVQKVVDAWDGPDDSGHWRRGKVVEQVTCCTESGRIHWKVRCSKLGCVFQSRHVCDTALAMQQLQSRVGNENLMKKLASCLPDAEVLEIRSFRLPSGVSALAVKLAIEDVGSLHGLRDRVLDGTFEQDINRKLLADSQPGDAGQVAVDGTAFLKLYEQHLLTLTRLTQHQREKLHEVESHPYVHLHAPAGAGKTFVAVQRVLNVLHSDLSARVLYVSPSPELVVYFVRWVVVQVSSQEEPTLRAWSVKSTLGRLVVAQRPYANFFSPVLADGRVSFIKAGSPGKIALVIIDEAHNVISPAIDQRFEALMGSTDYDSLLVLSDQSQAASMSTSFPNILTSVALTQVVRCTKRIVAAASAFQLSDQGSAFTSFSTAGPPLKSFLFEATEEADRSPAYAKHVGQAILEVLQEYPGISLHGRLALLVPDSSFCERLRPHLQQRLQKILPQRRFELVSYLDSLSILPEMFIHQDSQRDAAESIVLDTIEASDGLESLIVVCIALDAAVQRNHEDVANRSKLYKGLTRAQLLALVVNERIPDSLLEFLSNVRFDRNQLPPEEVVAAHCSFQLQKAVKEGEVPLEDRQDQKSAMGNSASEHREEGVLKGAESATPMPEAPWMASSVWDTSSNDPGARILQPLYDPLEDARRKQEDFYAQEYVVQARMETLLADRAAEQVQTFQAQAAECRRSGQKAEEFDNVRRAQVTEDKLEKLEARLALMQTEFQAEVAELQAEVAELQAQAAECRRNGQEDEAKAKEAQAEKAKTTLVLQERVTAEIRAHAESRARAAIARGSQRVDSG